MLSDDSDYTDKPQNLRSLKRRKLVERPSARQTFTFPLDTLFTVLREEYADEDDTYEALIEPLLPQLHQTRMEHEGYELDESAKKVRPLRTYESVALLHRLDLKDQHTLHESILRRKLKIEKDLSQLSLSSPLIESTGSWTILPKAENTPPDPVVLDSLHAIKTTPLNYSYLSRLHGSARKPRAGAFAVDWEIRTPWMALLEDIRAHYAISHPERELVRETAAPITYSSLDRSQLPQVHDLLQRSFWSGLDVNDSLDYQPERATVVAMYKKLVVGVAILKSPRETYMMYLAVKAGWDRAQIARTMLYHLITLNPQKDITLHVSTNNPAMLLYNQFGFKVEEFVAGFYAQYLDNQSRLSVNAFKLRLRHLQ